MSITIRGRPVHMPWTEKLLSKLRKREYRAAYVEEGVKTWIARQIRALRENRNWSQGKLGEEAGKAQPVISRLEDPDYGQMNLQTLFDLAKAFDVGVIVKFVDYPTFLRETNDVATSSMRVQSFDETSFVGFSQPANRIVVGSHSFGTQQRLMSSAKIGAGSLVGIPVGVGATTEYGIRD